MDNAERIVITGVGAVSPLGLNSEALWEGLIAGRPGVGPITSFDPSDLPVRIAAEVANFDARNYMDRKLARRVGRPSQFAIAAALEALSMADMKVNGQPNPRAGVVLGTIGGFFNTAGQVIRLRDQGPRKLDPLFIARNGPHMTACHVARFFGFQGPNTTLNSACASGSDAIGAALMHLRQGNADVILAGGTESLIAPLGIALMGQLGALSRRNDEPARASRPFDRDRDGFVLGEGAGVLVLETEAHARGRGAPILAEVVGSGWSFDAYDDTAPSAEGQALAMSAALRDACLSPQDVDYINAHGTSTQLNDRAETKAIKRVFGEQAYQIPISSTKSMTGHLACAAGALEAVICILVLSRGTIPPTINYEFPDPDCDLDYVPNEARAVQVDVCLSNSFGLGGQNACLILRRWQGSLPM
jgi:3-oxoacyl-[acyl-carrier-protein] synthase II